MKGCSALRPQAGGYLGTLANGGEAQLRKLRPQDSSGQSWISADSELRGLVPRRLSSLSDAVVVTQTL